jgi:tetratricopeptide (TPR) repeat protein
MEAWRRVLEIDSDNLHALRGLGEIHRIEGMWQEALRFYDRVLSRSPRDRHALAGKLLALRLSDDHEEERGAVEAALGEIDPEMLKLLLTAPPQGLPGLDAPGNGHARTDALDRRGNRPGHKGVAHRRGRRTSSGPT